MKEETKGLVWAVLLSIAIIYIVNWIFPATPVQTVPNSAQEVQPATISENTENTAQPLPESEVLAQDARLEIDTPALSGSIRLKGARLDSLKLKKYKQTLESDSPDVVLLAPQGSQDSYFAQLGWLSADSTLNLPNADSLWRTRGSNKLTPETPVVLEWDNGQGLKFVRTISVDENYLFEISQAVENNTDKTITLYPYGLLSRHYDYKAQNAQAVVHQGVSAVVDGTLKELRYSSIDDSEPETFDFQEGWAGFSDRYWFTALILENNEPSVFKVSNNGQDTYQVDYRGSALSVEPSAIASNKLRLFAGAKDIKLLDKYTDELNIKKLDLAVDFGWYYFLTKPFFYILTFLYNLIGNMGWAILLFAAILRLLMFPIANKSFESMSKMKKLQPKVMALQTQYKDNKALLQQATLELYRREKINPASGCLPLFIQIPVFFSLYKVLNIALEIRHAPFIGWIKDLSAPDPLTISVWSHIPLPSLLDIGVWPILMGFTMWIQQKLNPAPVNKDQARMFALMPFIFTLMLGHFASGLVIYWTLNNLLSIVQQKAIMRKNGVN